MLNADSFYKIAGRDKPKHIKPSASGAKGKLLKVLRASDKPMNVQLLAHKTLLSTTTVYREINEMTDNNEVQQISSSGRGKNKPSEYKLL